MQQIPYQDLRIIILIGHTFYEYEMYNQKIFMQLLHCAFNCWRIQEHYSKVTSLLISNLQYLSTKLKSIHFKLAALMKEKKSLLTRSVGLPLDNIKRKLSFLAFHADLSGSKRCNGVGY